MNITFVMPCYPWRPIGAFRVVYEYANHLVARGHQVTVVHPRRVKDEQGVWAPRGLYRRLRRHAGKMRNLILVPKIHWQEIDGRVQMLYVSEPVAGSVPDADAVFATAWDTVDYVCRYPESKGTKFHLIQSYDRWSQLGDPTDAAWRSSVDKVVISKWLRDRMAELGCHETTYIPNAVNLSRFRVINPIAERPPRVAMLYSLAECKGSQDGLLALEIAKRDHPDLRAVLFGIPKRPRSLHAWIEYVRDPSPVELVGNVYNGSSIFLCPSRVESFALPAAEAMACGCALVTADCGGNREYAEHEVTALISPPRKPGLLAQNLIRALANESLRLRLVQGGNGQIRQFSWERSGAKFEAFIYERTSSRRASPQTAGCVAGLASHDAACLPK